jgi:hypothetical protein
MASNYMSGSMMQPQQQKPVAQQRPMGLGMMGGAMQQPQAKPSPFSSMRGVPLRDALGRGGPMGGRMMPRQPPMGVRQMPMQPPAAMGGAMQQPVQPKVPELDAPFRPAPGMGVRPMPQQPPQVAPPLPPPPSSSVGEPQISPNTPPGGPFNGYPTLAAWQLATFGQQF